MNFIAATVQLETRSSEPVQVYGLNFVSASAIIPSGNQSGDVRLRLLCFNTDGPKLEGFKNWKEGTRALVTGHIVFSEDTAEPLDLIISTLEPNVSKDMYCNQVVLGNAFFGSDEIKERKSGQLAIKIGTTLDNSDVTTWLYMETDESRKKKLTERVRKGRPICVQGYIREYRKDDSDSPYRAIVANDFTTRKDSSNSRRNPQTNGTAAGYTQVDPTPEY